MLKYRATSTRVTDGHGANCLSNSREVAEDWAKGEFAGGHEAVIYEVAETPVAWFNFPRCKTPACKKRLTVEATRCPECGRHVEVTSGK